MDNDSCSTAKKGFPEGYWSKDELKDNFLDEQRKYLWNKDYWRNVLVPLLKLKQDSVILDVGCGLGFLGQNLAEFVPNGKIIGVDSDAKLIEAAKKIVNHSKFGEVFGFCVGNAYELPVDSDTIDLSICQTLLGHLEKPMKAVSEMRRVTKKGGGVVAIEQDYSGVSSFDSAFEKIGYSLEERVKLWRLDRILSIGKKKMGKGEWEIGLKVPYLFFKGGLHVADVRCMDRVHWLIPPYQGQELQLKHILLPPEFMVEIIDMHNQFLAGGGTEDEWVEYFDLMKKLHEIRQQQIKEETFVCLSSTSIMVTIAKKI